MELPSLRHFRNEGIFFISSDPVEALTGEAWVPAIYTDKGWATADGSTLLSAVEDWRYAVKEGQQQKDDPGKYQTGNQSGKTAKASGSNRIRKSRKITQAEG
jgi:hypothetical protein